MIRKYRADIEQFNYKETLCEDRTPILRINIKGIELKCDKKHPLARHAEKYYKSLCSSFRDFAKTTLFGIAREDFLSRGGEFPPYSALLVSNACRDEKYLSVITDILLTNGQEEIYKKRICEVFSTESGNKCRLGDFFTKGEIKELLSSVPKKQRRGIVNGGFFVCNGEFTLFDGREEIKKIIPNL